MKAVTWHGVGDIRFGDVPDPRIEEPTDAIVRVTTSAICGTDLDDRLALARAQHAEVVDFNVEDPVQTILDLTGGVGVDRVIDAVGVDAERPAEGPATRQVEEQAGQFDTERGQVAPKTDPAWAPGDAPSLAARWAVEAVAKAGTVGVIGVYPQTVTSYPFGAAMMKNLTVKAGNCHHRRYIPTLLQLVTNGTVDPAQLLTEHEPLTDVLAAYRQFQDRDPGWLKVALTAEPATTT